MSEEKKSKEKGIDLADLDSLIAGTAGKPKEVTPAKSTEPEFDEKKIETFIAETEEIPLKVEIPQSIVQPVKQKIEEKSIISEPPKVGVSLDELLSGKVEVEEVKVDEIKRELEAEITEIKKPEGDVTLLKIFEEEEKFDVQEESQDFRMVYTIAGEKDSGKTVIALDFINFEGDNKNTVAAIAFDNKTARVWYNDYHANKNIHVFNGNKYFKYAKREELTIAAKKTIIYLGKILDKIAEIKPDWILIDNFEKYTRIAEFAGRHSQGLGAFETPPKESGKGYKIWDERNYHIMELFNRCFDISKKGVIYAIYLDDIQKIREGTVIETSKIPKWISEVKYETDVTLILERTSSRTYGLEIAASKDDDNIPNGLKLDVTDKGLWKALREFKDLEKKRIEVKIGL